jgi:hypothetical protein
MRFDHTPSHPLSNISVTYIIVSLKFALIKST